MDVSLGRVVALSSCNDISMTAELCYCITVIAVVRLTEHINVIMCTSTICTSTMCTSTMCTSTMCTSTMWHYLYNTSVFLFSAIVMCSTAVK